MDAEMASLMLDGEVREGLPHNAAKACGAAPRVADE